MLDIFTLVSVILKRAIKVSMLWSDDNESLLKHIFMDNSTKPNIYCQYTLNMHDIKTVFFTAYNCNVLQRIPISMPFLKYNEL